MGRQRNVDVTRNRGFNQFAKTVRDNPYLAKSIARCESCVFFSDKEECTNNNVTSFDMYEDEHGVKSCTFWRGVAYDNGRKKQEEDDWGW